jgi:hypothetical protein
MIPMPSDSRSRARLIICGGFVCDAFCPALGQPIGGVWWRQKACKMLQYTENLPRFQGAFPVARRQATATTKGARLNLEMVHDCTSCE